MEVELAPHCKFPTPALLDVVNGFSCASQAKKQEETLANLSFHHL